MTLDTKAKIGYINALNDLPITYTRSDGWELINLVTGEIFQAATRDELLPIRAREIGYIKDLPYPDIPYGIII